MSSSADDLHVEDGILYHRPCGKVSFHEVTLLALKTLAKARELQLTRAIFYTKDLYGFSVPDITDRYEFVTTLAEEAGPIKFAVVAHSAMIDFQRFGSIVALNRCFHADIFTSADEAKQWLLRFKS
jgi:hypothetical protein